jgi:hypothetical protein
MWRIWLPKGLPVLRIVWMSGTAEYAAGTDVHYWSALYAAADGVASGVPLGQSADNTAPAIQASALQVMPLATPSVIAASGYYYLALHLSMTGGTMPSASGYLGLGGANDMSPKAAYRYATGSASGTAPAASGPGAAQLAGQVYIGVS